MKKLMFIILILSSSLYGQRQVKTTYNDLDPNLKRLVDADYTNLGIATSGYSSFSAALTAAESQGKVLIINNDVTATVSARDTVDVQVYVTPEGSMTVTRLLVFNERVTADDNQIFYGNVDSIIAKGNSFFQTRWTGAVGDGSTDDSNALNGLMAMMDTTSVWEITNGIYNLNGDTLLLPAGITIDAKGGILYNGYIDFTNNNEGLFKNTTIKNLHTKQVQYIMVDTTSGVGEGWLSQVIFDGCYIDGSNLSGTGSTDGYGVYQLGYVFDIQFVNTHIQGFDSAGVYIQGNEEKDLSGEPYPGTGVQIVFNNVSIRNCGWNIGGTGEGKAIQVMGSSLDGMSIHIAESLLDHCGYGLYVDNTPRPGTAGEININITNTRIEWCNQAIYSQGGNIYGANIWALGMPNEKDGINILNDSCGTDGHMQLHGRIAGYGQALYVHPSLPRYNTVLSGLLGGGTFSTNAIYKDRQFEQRFMSNVITHGHIYFADSLYEVKIQKLIKSGQDNFLMIDVMGAVGQRSEVGIARYTDIDSPDSSDFIIHRADGSYNPAVILSSSQLVGFGAADKEGNITKRVTADSVNFLSLSVESDSLAIINLHRYTNTDSNEVIVRILKGDNSSSNIIHEFRGDGNAYFNLMDNINSSVFIGNNHKLQVVADTLCSIRISTTDTLRIAPSR